MQTSCKLGKADVLQYFNFRECKTKQMEPYDPLCLHVDTLKAMVHETCISMHKPNMSMFKCIANASSMLV